MTSPTSFYEIELRTSLEEQWPCIKSFHILQSSEYEAVARVRLLEGKEVEIALTARGFSVEETSAVFEAVDELLSSQSTLYQAKRQEMLMAKLELLNRRSTDRVTNV